MRHPSRFLLLLPALAGVATPAGAQLFQTDPSLVRCESVHSQEVSCAIPKGKVAVFVRQESQAACTAGSTYWIKPDAIVVNQGCRASFRFTDAPPPPGDGLTDAMRMELRTRADTAIEARLEKDYRNSRSPRFELVSDEAHALSANETAYGGKGRIMVDGKTWQDITFDSVYDWKTKAFRNVAYQLGTAPAPADGAMDKATEAALVQALAAEVRRQKGGGDVQVAVNRRFTATKGMSYEKIEGKFGYSWNDGDWLTRGYEAELDATGQKVNAVRIWQIK